MSFTNGYEWSKMSSMILYEKVQQLIEELKTQNPPVTIYDIAHEVGTNYNNLRDAINRKNGRKLSDEQLKALVQSRHIPYTYNQLKSWEEIDRVGIEVFLETAEEAKRLWQEMQNSQSN